MLTPNELSAMFKAFFERQRIKKTLGQYVAPEVLKEVLDGKFAPVLGTTSRRRVEVAFIAVTAADAARYSEYAGKIADIAIAHQGVIDSLLPVIVISFGTFERLPVGDRLGFVNVLQRQFAGVLAIVHGAIIAEVGTFGSERYMYPGFWSRDVMKLLGMLTTLAPGEVYEIPPGAGA